MGWEIGSMEPIGMATEADQADGAIITDSNGIIQFVYEQPNVRPFDPACERNDNTPIEVSLCISPIRNSEGEVVGASAISRDISAGRRFDRELQEAGDKYRRIVDGAMEGMFQVSLEGKFLAANSALAVMLGYDSGDEILSRADNIAEITWVHQDERSRFLQKLDLDGSVRRFECEIRRKDGGIVWTSLSCRKVSAADRQLLYYEGFTEDITERKCVEESLREHGDFLKDAQMFGAFGCYVLDIHAGLWTSSCVLDDLFGIDAKYDRTVDGWTALIHPDDRSRMVGYFAREVVGNCNAFEKEYRIIRHNDHGERWVHGIGTLEFDADRRPMKMRGIIKDITARKRAEMQLRDSESRYRSTFEQAAVGIAHCSFDGKFIRCNTRFAEIVGYPIEEVPGLTVLEITVAEDLAATENALQQMANGTFGASAWQKRYIRKDGSLSWVKVTVSTQRNAEGLALHSIALVEDINVWKAAEECLVKAQNALRKSEARYRTVFQTSLDCVMITRMSDWTFIDVNQAFLSLVGFEYDAVIGRSFAEFDILPGQGFLQTLEGVLSQHADIRNIETQFTKRNGELFWALMSASVIEIEGASCVLCVVKDISDAKAAEVEIRQLAFYDPLTGLPNRRLLLDRLFQTLNTSSRTGRMVALLFVDLDNFKTLNDTLGHHTGDLLLQEVAHRITGSLRDVDTVARLGGDEFVVLLEGLNEHSESAAAEAKAVGEKILAAVGKTYMLNGRECLSTSSIGITVFWDHLENVDDVLQKAELAMYQAKAAGRNTIRFFAPALQAAVNARATMEEALRQAIRLNQFLLYYQPQVDRGCIVGAEALIRWKHPSRGILAPGEFILLAEETGQILPLGNWVLETACMQIAAWADHEQTVNITVAVNISARQFRQPEFVNQVLAALDRTGANPRNLKLELTESMLLDDVDDVIAKMAALKAHGLKFSLDDFGTGYSSLSYLKRLPLDQLKIDKSFVQDLLVDCRGGAIAQAIVALGRAMGLSVIAEGVETEEQRDFLAGLDCHLFQGYLFSRPRPLEEFLKLLPQFSEFSVPTLR